MVQNALPTKSETHVVISIRGGPQKDPSTLQSLLWGVETLLNVAYTPDFKVFSGIEGPIPKLKISKNPARSKTVISFSPSCFP